MKLIIVKLIIIMTTYPIFSIDSLDELNHHAQAFPISLHKYSEQKDSDDHEDEKKRERKKVKKNENGHQMHWDHLF